MQDRQDATPPVGQKAGNDWNSQCRIHDYLDQRRHKQKLANDWFIVYLQVVTTAWSLSSLRHFNELHLKVCSMIDREHPNPFGVEVRSLAMQS